VGRENPEVFGLKRRTSTSSSNAKCLLFLLAWLETPLDLNLLNLQMFVGWSYGQQNPKMFGSEKTASLRQTSLS
jgi:hypothetical protein